MAGANVTLAPIENISSKIDEYRTELESVEKYLEKKIKILMMP